MPWGLIIIGAVFIGLKLLASMNAGKQQQPRPPIRPPVRPPGGESEREQRVHWEASQEQLDKFLGQQQQRPARAEPPQRPYAAQQPVPPRPPQRPASPLQQILQMPAQIAEAQRQIADERQQIARERQQLAQQMRELERRRQAAPAQARRQPARPARPAAPTPVTAKSALRGAANLRRAVVLAEVLGPPKALRKAHRHRGGLI